MVSGAGPSPDFTPLSPALSTLALLLGGHSHTWNIRPTEWVFLEDKMHGLIITEMLITSTARPPSPTLPPPGPWQSHS